MSAVEFTTGLTGAAVLSIPPEIAAQLPKSGKARIIVLTDNATGTEAMFEVEQRVELRESQGLKVRELAKAEELATEHRGLIIQKWHERFNR